MDTTRTNKLPNIAFMVGMGRSGTTLLTNMLNSHPNLVSTPENEFILFAEHSFKNKDFSDPKVVDDFLDLFNYNFHTEPSIWVPSDHIREDIESSPDKSFATVCKLVYLNNPFAGQKQHISWVIDKNPIYSLHLKKLHALFPDARYIVMVRNHKDNVLSRKKYAYKPTSIFELGVSWSFYYEQLLHYVKVLGITPYIMRYEDLASDPASELKKLCAYLKVDYRDEMLHYKGKAAELKKHLKENRSGEKYDKVEEMHGNLEKDVNTSRINAFEKELNAEENEILDFICYETAKKFGYAKEKPAGKPGWQVKKRFYELKMSLYLKKQNRYYNTPIESRLPAIEKIK